MPGLTVGTALSWIDAKYINPDDPEYGLVPYGTVARQASFLASYEIQSGRFKGLGAGVMVVSIGDRSLSYANSGLRSDSIFLKGYERVDLNFFYKGLPDWDISFQIRNLFDEVYIERMRGISGGNFFGSPQAFLFRANYKLGAHDLKNFLR